MCELTKASERISQAGCELSVDVMCFLFKGEQFHEVSASRSKHSCVPRFALANIHLYFTLGWGPDFPAALPAVSVLLLRLLLTSPLVNNGVNTSIVRGFRDATNFNTSHQRT